MSSTIYIKAEGYDKKSQFYAQNIHLSGPMAFVLDFLLLFLNFYIFSSSHWISRH